METHFKSLSAIYPIIIRTHFGQKQILLLKRMNAGYMDENESAIQAVAREFMLS